jgi:hypothetical protein
LSFQHNPIDVDYVVLMKTPVLVLVVVVVVVQV